MRSIPAVAVLALLAGCGDGGPPPESGPAAEADEPSGEWVTVLERSLQQRRSTPERFLAPSDSLRVITLLGASTSPYAPGLVITNLLSDSSSYPVASIRAEPDRPEAGSADTVVVEVPRGPLYLFVAEHRGLEDWRVTVQALRARPDSAARPPAPGPRAPAAAPEGRASG